MFRSVGRTAVAAVVAMTALGAFAPGSQAITLFTDRAAWELSADDFLDVDLAGQTTEGGILGAGTTINLPYDGDTIKFDFDMEVRQVPSSWGTWSNGNTPRVLYNSSEYIITATFDDALQAFGLEMEPNDFAIYEMTMQLSSGQTITQMVDGFGGAAFFGFTGGFVSSLTLSCGAAQDCDFAFGRMVQGQPIPEPATLALFTLGVAGLGFARRRRIA